MGGIEIKTQKRFYNSHQSVILTFFLIISFADLSFSQNPKEFKNDTFLKKLNHDKSYSDLKKKTVLKYKNTPAGHWGEFVKGVDERIQTNEKNIAFTFDACGGKNGNGYDKDLIEYLQREKIPATLFITGKWIDAQFDTFLNLSRNPMFEIENHGLNHRPCSICGETIYGIKGTPGIEEAFDEIEANACKIEAITGHHPRFYRSATAYIDEACADMVVSLGIIPVSYQVLSGDAIVSEPEKVIEKDVIKNIKPGAIVIMHFNHPKGHTKEAMEKIVPALRKIGYNFVLLKDFRLTSVKKEKKLR